MQASDLVEALIERIYDEISAEEPWHRSLQSLQTAVAAQTLVLQMSVEGRAGQSWFLAAGARTHPAHIREWETRSRDQLISLALPPGRIETCNDYLRKRPREGFIELIRRYDVARGMSAHVLKRGAAAYSLHALRSGRNAPFGAVEEQLFGRILPHLSRAIGLRAEIAQAGDRQMAAAEALDGCGIGMIVLDFQEQVTAINARATLQIKECGLHLNDRRLHADQAPVASRLNGALAAALAAAPECPFRAAIQLANGGHALIRSSPQRDANFDRPMPAATILIISQAVPASGAATDLTTLFDLTPAAAQVAAYLAAGMTAVEIQSAMGIRYTTLRSHMAQLFSKLDCESQSELVHRLTRLLPILH